MHSRAQDPSRLHTAILGDGGWGTTLAIHLLKKGELPTLWSPFPEYCAFLKKERRNPKFLPDIPIPCNLEITDDLACTLGNADIITLAIPSRYMRGILERIKGLPRKKEAVFVSVSKGIEHKTLLRMSELIVSILGEVPLAILSGPTIAKELASGVPTTAVIASRDNGLSKNLQSLFTNGNFRIYTSCDVVGVELGGALKNVIAIACGISDGMGYKSNAKAALITRGLAEMSRLGTHFGAEASTFMGLSGMGDLITTCISPFSRNRSLGEAIGQGRSLRHILDETEMVIEGVDTVVSAYELSVRCNIDMPITQTVYAVLYQEKNPRTAVSELFSRPLKAEKS
ncbi:MAG: NAD(P)-dependent glycerol-3-phosphate dehydrogenase [Candidatus Omnitrophica bacterium]|nr:NAD(P)-dependent glycerol-3-phosphate dehydrogenase [Candidatus Omnitrophota bacterium]